MNPKENNNYIQEQIRRNEVMLAGMVLSDSEESQSSSDDEDSSSSADSETDDKTSSDEMPKDDSSEDKEEHAVLNALQHVEVIIEDIEMLSDESDEPIDYNNQLLSDNSDSGYTEDKIIYMDIDED